MEGGGWGRGSGRREEEEFPNGKGFPSLLTWVEYETVCVETQDAFTPKVGR